MQIVFVKNYKHFLLPLALFRSQIGFQSWHRSSLWATHRSRHHQVCWYVCNINRWTEWGRVDGVNKNSMKTDSLALDIFATKKQFQHVLSRSVDVFKPLSQTFLRLASQYEIIGFNFYLVYPILPLLKLFFSSNPSPLKFIPFSILDMLLWHCLSQLLQILQKDKTKENKTFLPSVCLAIRSGFKNNLTTPFFFQL